MARPKYTEVVAVVPLLEGYTVTPAKLCTFRGETKVGLNFPASAMKTGKWWHAPTQTWHDADKLVGALSDYHGVAVLKDQ